MQAALDLIRAEPWPFIGAGIALAVIFNSRALAATEDAAPPQ